MIATSLGAAEDNITCMHTHGDKVTCSLPNGQTNSPRTFLPISQTN